MLPLRQPRSYRLVGAYRAGFVIVVGVSQLFRIFMSDGFVERRRVEEYRLGWGLLGGDDGMVTGL